MSKKILINSLIGLSFLVSAKSFAWNMCVIDELINSYHPDMYATASIWTTFDTLQKKGDYYCTNIQTGPVVVSLNNPNNNGNCSTYTIPYDQSMKGPSGQHPWIEVHDDLAVLFFYDVNNNGSLTSKNYDSTRHPCRNFRTTLSKKKVL